MAHVIKTATTMKQITTHRPIPNEPLQGFNEWEQYIHTQREENTEFTRYKREIELSFDRLHQSITTQAIPKH